MIYLKLLPVRLLIAFFIASHLLFLCPAQAVQALASPLNNLAPTENSLITKDKGSVRVAFSPHGQAEELILQTIASAQKSIKVAAYAFTSKPISLALLAAKKKGVDVKVVADAKAGKGKYSAVSFLANHNVPVRLNANYSIFHHKFMIIDEKDVQTGSFNYSSAAANKNAENVVVLENMPQVALAYEHEWQLLWNESEELPPAY